MSAPGGLTSLAERVYAEFPIEIADEPSFDDEDLVVIVDTGDAALIQNWVEGLRKASCVKVLIDHHPPSESLSGIVQFSVTNQRASSTSEIVFDLWRRLKLTPNETVSQALLTGIMADSQHLTRADEDTINEVGKLCKLGASLRKSRRLLRVRLDRSEVIARLKGAKRIQIFEARKWIIAITRVGAFHASVARSLVDVGADLALALGTQVSGSRGTFRSSQEFYEESGIHLGIDLAQKISAALNGSGGGHPTAASVQCLASLPRLFKEAKKVIAEALGEQLNQID